MTLTLEMILEAKRKLDALPKPSVPYPVPVFISNAALEETDERLFKVSRYRSARTRKKLIKRHGGEFKKVPCIWMTPQGMVCHPARYAELNSALQAQRGEPQNDG